MMQGMVSDILFRYQLELEEDISCVDTLVRAAVEVEVGLEAGEVREWLAGEGAGRGVREIIEEEAKKIREGGVQGVPHFIIGGNYHIDGAVDVTEFFQKVVEFKEREGGGGGGGGDGGLVVTTGASCKLSPGRGKMVC